MKKIVILASPAFPLPKKDRHFVANPIIKTSISNYEVPPLLFSGESHEVGKRKKKYG